MTVLRHLRAIALLPVMVLIVIPGALVLLTDTHAGWGLDGAPAALPVALGGLLLAAGIGLLAWTVGLFSAFGRGTLAPWNPTQRLVVRGAYRHLRNPMISGVLLALLGEAALLGSSPILAWAVIFSLANAIYIPRVEERGLERRFGEEYREYRRNVPAWIPRLTPWQPPPGAAAPADTRKEERA
jgi:protein-S-isoprenylcysteine O-methyltransferase Ste14